MTSKMTQLSQAIGLRDPARASGAGRRCSDPEVPERSRRGTFTAQHKVEALAVGDVAPDGEEGVGLGIEGLYFSRIKYRAAQNSVSS